MEKFRMWLIFKIKFFSEMPYKTSFGHLYGLKANTLYCWLIDILAAFYMLQTLNSKKRSFCGGKITLYLVGKGREISDHTEYDNKGNAVRTYQPYFVNNRKYVSDDSARQDLYPNTHYYEPPGWGHNVVTKKGYQRWILFTPWFVISEYENNAAK
ncbi:hypothetical protein GCM10009131_03830 [Morganella psychrotolerans]